MRCSRRKLRDRTGSRAPRDGSRGAAEGARSDIRWAAKGVAMRKIDYDAQTGSVVLLFDQAARSFEIGRWSPEIRDWLRPSGLPFSFPPVIGRRWKPSPPKRPLPPRPLACKGPRRGWAGSPGEAFRRSARPLSVSPGSAFWAWASQGFPVGSPICGPHRRPPLRRTPPAERARLKLAPPTVRSVVAPSFVGAMHLASLPVPRLSDAAQDPEAVTPLPDAPGSRNWPMRQEMDQLRERVEQAEAATAKAVEDRERARSEAQRELADEHALVETLQSQIARTSAAYTVILQAWRASRRPRRARLGRRRAHRGTPPRERGGGRGRRRPGHDTKLVARLTAPEAAGPPDPRLEARPAQAEPSREAPNAQEAATPAPKADAEAASLREKLDSVRTQASIMEGPRCATRSTRAPPRLTPRGPNWRRPK